MAQRSSPKVGSDFGTDSHDDIKKRLALTFSDEDWVSAKVQCILKDEVSIAMRSCMLKKKCKKQPLFWSGNTQLAYFSKESLAKLSSWMTFIKTHYLPISYFSSLN